ncbi:MAG: hypothetical protein ACRCX4_02585 [Bacteroidales bacterium]
MKIRKSILLPSALLVYLGVITYMSYPEYKINQNHLEYFGTIAGTIAIIVVLYFFLRKREKMNDHRSRRKDASFRRRS